jgi:hypothetical protein
LVLTPVAVAAALISNIACVVIPNFSAASAALEPARNVSAIKAPNPIPAMLRLN